MLLSYYIFIFFFRISYKFFYFQTQATLSSYDGIAADCYVNPLDTCTGMISQQASHYDDDYDKPVSF